MPLRQRASHGPELLELLKRCSVTSAKTSVTGGGVAIGLLDNQTMLVLTHLPVLSRAPYFCATETAKAAHGNALVLLLELLAVCMDLPAQPICPAHAG